MAEETNTHAATLAVLREGAWFRGLDVSLLEEIAALSVQREYSSGELIFARHEVGGDLYGIMSGSVRVSAESPNGRELTLNTMYAGDVGGEIACLDGGVRTATWRAQEDTQVFAVSRKELQALMLRCPQIALHMIDILCGRVRRASRQVEDAAFLTLPERLAQQLVVMVREAGNPQPCRISISQSQLASFLNTSRQLVNRVLQTWQKAGYVTLSRGAIVVLDVEGLAAGEQFTE